MNIEDIREFCLSLPKAEEAMPFGDDLIVFKIGGKIFLLLPLDEDSLRFNVKCDPEKAIELRAEYPCVQPGYHMNKKHWNTVHVDGSATDEMVKEWIRHSYDLVKPKKKS